MFVNQMAEMKPRKEHSFFDYNAFIYEENGEQHLCLVDGSFDVVVIDNGEYCVLQNDYDARTVERFISDKLPDAQFVRAFKDNEYQLRFCPLSSPEPEPGPEFF